MTDINEFMRTNAIMKCAMTPLHIKILLHYYVSTDEYERGYYPSTAGEYIHDLFEMGLIEEKDRPIVEPRHRISDKGKFYVNVLCTTPLPVHQWIIPRQEDKP